MNEQLVVLAIVISLVSGLVACLAGTRSPWGDWLAAGLMVVAAGMGITGALRQLAGFSTGSLVIPWTVLKGGFVIQVDSLSALFIVQIFLVGALGSLYGIGYWSARSHSETVVKVRVFFGLMVAGMALLVVAKNAVLFLMGWEIMALSAFLLVSTEDRDPAVRQAGLVYLFATRIGTLCLIAMFLVLGALNGSFSLEFRGLSATSTEATIVFVLALAGFGLKAGVMPLHVWLPAAHANAPSHVSALMSGVLIKMGIYGLFRTLSFFDAPPLWWGLTLFGLGVLSAVLGVAFALGQHDLKRLLAYHSVENIGIILMGFGLGVIGRTLHQPILVSLGMAGALLHVWNHGLFKALLFLSAGSVIHATHTREIDALGGLAKLLPRTSVAFLVGAVAISGLPPLNGFVSEFLVYLGMLQSGFLELEEVGLVLVLGVPALALVGALAVACFVKVYGAVFLGEPRRPHDRAVRESPAIMLVPMAVLAGFCAIIGAVPGAVVPALDRAVLAWTGSASASLPLASLVPLGTLTQMTAGLLLAVAVTSAVLIKLTGPARRVHAGTWDCGYVAPTPRMQYTASSFAEGLVDLFAGALRPQTHAPKLNVLFPSPSRFESHVPEVVLDLAVLPVVRLLVRIAGWSRWIQQGQLHLYLVYILATLLAMLLFWR